MQYDAIHGPRPVPEIYIRLSLRMSTQNAADVIEQARSYQEDRFSRLEAVWIYKLVKLHFGCRTPVAALVP